MAVRVLVVDDAPFMRHVVKKQLLAAGFEIAAEAAGGREAVVKYALTKPTVVLLDMELPENAGQFALEAIRATDPNARVIAVAGPSGNECLSKAVQLGAVEFTQKPYRIEKVSAVIGRVLQSSAGKSNTL